MGTVEAKIQTIQNIFRDVQDNFPEAYSLPELAEKLDRYEIEFRSIAYEAASFCMALKDLETGNALSHWEIFLRERGTPHATQIHVGLGWALAQKQIDPFIYFSVINPMMRYRLFDGYGYYEGIFRRRKSILSQQKPEWEDEVASGAYDQGIGRCLWYLSLGEIHTAVKMIDAFPKERQADLWRGLGIAITYAGGCDETQLQEILLQSGKHAPQLKTGAIMALISRHLTGLITDDALVTCDFWLKVSTKEIIARFAPQLNSEDTLAYKNWIGEIEAGVQQI